MNNRIEHLLRATELSETDKQIILKGIAQITEADGVIDPREREYLKDFVTEFFPDADPTDPKLTEQKLTKEDIKAMSSDDARLCFIAFLTIGGYVDDDFSPPEREFIKNLTDDIVPAETRMKIQHEVRRYLYRRAVFAFALNNGYLHPEFAKKMAERFDVSYDEAIEMNQDVFNAVMAIKGQSESSEEAHG